MFPASFSFFQLLSASFSFLQLLSASFSFLGGETKTKRHFLRRRIPWQILLPPTFHRIGFDFIGFLPVGG